MNIRNYIVPENLWDLKCTYKMTPRCICIHNTANNASAENEAHYVHTNPAATSFHFAVDDTGAVQILPLDRNGWHAGDGADGKGNRYSIGIEICYSAGEKELFERSQENSAILCARLMHDFGWGLDLSRITKHEDYSKKHCPERTLDDYGWDYYLALVKEKYEELYPEDVPLTKEEKAEFDKLVKSVQELKSENETLKNSIDKLKEAVAPCITSVNWNAHVTDAMGGKEAVDMLNKLTKNGDFAGQSKGKYALSEQMVRMMLIFYRMLVRLGLYK